MLLLGVCSFASQRVVESIPLEVPASGDGCCHIDVFIQAQLPWTHVRFRVGALARPTHAPSDSARICLGISQVVQLDALRGGEAADSKAAAAAARPLRTLENNREADRFRVTIPASACGKNCARSRAVSRSC